MSGAESESADHRLALRRVSLRDRPIVVAGATKSACARMVCTALATIMLCTGAIVAQESSAPPPALSILLQALGRSEDPAAQLNLLRGMNAALKGRRNVAAPPEWPALAEKLAQSSNAEVKEQAQTLGAVFGSSGAFDAMRATVTKSNAESNARLKALESLVAAQDKATLSILQQLVKEPGVLRRAAIRGLAAYDDEAVPGLLLGAYASFDSDEKRDAIGTLLARIPWARRLVTALEKSEVGRADLAAPHLRQLAGLKDPAIEAWVQRNPEAFAAAGNRQAEIARYKSFLTAETIARGDRNHGRALFNQICAACHTLFGSGGTNGPELTGSNRTDIDYLLQNIVDPNALIGKDYQSTTVETKDGRMLVGMIRSDDANSVTLKTLAEPVIISRNDIKSLTVSDVSMMPEGLLAAFAQEQVRDLFAYLASPRQVPILATPLNAADFFNGSDLARWRPSNDQWRVENGEIVGRAGGSAPVSLQSEMIAEGYVFTAQLKISRGDDLAAEIAFRGDVEQAPFAGCSLSFGGGSGVNLWQYGGEKPQSFAGGMIVTPDVWHPLEIRVLGENARVMLDGMMAFDVKKTAGGPRNGFGLYLGGNRAELRIKEARLEVLPR